MELQNEVWEKLGSPKYILAPMVDASELAFRMMCRKYGAELCYTPMMNSGQFVKDPKYRKTNFSTNQKDRPLIVQFAGDDAKIILKAALLVEPYCDCIDINLGCPQAIAKRGHYGAFLQDEWDNIAHIVQTLRQHLNIPVSCKIRIFESISKTVDYAKMLESAGCQLLGVHGRTREQKGPLQGRASWAHIKAVKAAVNIPVIANGNIRDLDCVQICLDDTNCDAVMSAEGILKNPTLFYHTQIPICRLAEEYLTFAQQFPCPNSFVRGHLFKMLHPLLLEETNRDIQHQIAKGKSIEDFISAVKALITRQTMLEGE